MKNTLSITLILLLFTGLFYSCKESPNNPALEQSKVEFVFSSSQVKSASEQGLTNVVITVEDEQGNTVLNSEKIDIYHMNGKYISEPVEMPTGTYQLTRFLVLNGDNDVVYATPVEGSDKAHLVEHPLPITFSASKDSVSEIKPEVILVADSKPEEFGYVSFSFEIADSFKILMGAAVMDSTNNNYKLTTANVEIFSGEILVYQGLLDPFNGAVDSTNYDTINSVNEIVLPELYNEFTIIVSKWGYKNYNKTFTKEELRLYYREEDKGPLIAILDTACNLPVGAANFQPYPTFQVWPDRTIMIQNYSIQDADEYHFDFGDGKNAIHTSFNQSLSHNYDTSGIYWITLTVTKNGCMSEFSDSVVIAQAFAGYDQTISNDTTEMDAGYPHPFVGTWSIVSGSAIIVDVNDPKSAITNIQAGTNVFRWTIDYNGTDVSDEVSITYNP